MTATASEPADSSLIRVLFESEESRPEQVYFLANGTPVTYAEARRVVNSAARWIRSQRWFSKTAIVAVSSERSEELLYAIWACVDAGVSLAFCAPCQDVSTMHSMVSRLGASVLLTDLPNLSGHDRVASLADLIRLCSDDPSAKEPLPAENGDAGFIFQTSGTEGEPKWVVCRYTQCRAAVESMLTSQALGHAVGQTVFLTAPLSHSYGLSALLEYTRAGSTIAFPSGTSPLGPVGELREAGLAEQVTAIEGVPHFYSQLAKLSGRLRLPALRHVGFGGGALDTVVVDRLRAHHPGITISVRYGLTETPSVVTHKVFRPPYDSDWRSSGRVLPVYTVTISDASGKKLAPGEEGEIVVGGECVAAYFPGDRESPARVLNTGDLGYISEKGELYVVGRRSAFLKYRGFRISPEQIESVVGSFDRVKDCRASTRDSRLILEVVMSDLALTRADLLTHLVERLPSHAMPEEIIEVDAIPRTASGKTKRH